MWVVADAELLRSVLDDARFSVRPSTQPVPPQLLDGSLAALFSKLIRMRDDPLRGSARALVVALLGAVSPPALELEVERQAHAILSAHTSLTQRLHALQFDLPVRALAAVLGLVSLSAQALPEHVHAFVRALAADADAQRIARGERAAQLLVEAIARDTNQRSPTERVVNILGLLMQSYDASAGLIGNALLALQRQGLLEQARSWPRHTMLKHIRHTQQNDPTIHNTRRYAAQRCTLAGQTVEQDAALLLVLASARAEELGWGAGAHACPGRDIACLLASSALRTLLSTSIELEHVAARASYLPLPNARIPCFGPQA